MSGAPNSGSPESTQTDGDQEKAKRNHNYSQYALRALRAAGRGVIAVVNWTDQKDGFITALATVCIAVLTAYYVHYAHNQWNVMQGQLGEMIQQYPALQISADAAEKANKGAHENLTRSNRPWLGVDSIKLDAPLTANKTENFTTIGYAIDSVIKNYGTSPALSVQVFEQPFAPNAGNPSERIRIVGTNACSLADGNEITKANPSMYGGAIFPNQTTTYTWQGGNFVEGSVSQGQFIQWVGCIAYRDQFGETTHHTHFCFLVKIGELGPVNNCGVNQEAD